MDFAARRTAEWASGRAGVSNETLTAGVQGAKVLWSSRERAFGPSPVSRYLDRAAHFGRAAIGPRGGPSAPHIPLPRRTNQWQAGTLQSSIQRQIRFCLGRGGAPKSPHARWNMQVQLEAAVATDVGYASIQTEDAGSGCGLQLLICLLWLDLVADKMRYIFICLNPMPSCPAVLQCLLFVLPQECVR
jgi:hypothetical protein